MRQSTHLLFVSVFFSAMLPVTAWGFGFADYPGDRSDHPYVASAEGRHYSGSLRLQKGMTADGYYVRAYLDGLRPQDVQVYLRRNQLVLQAAQANQHVLNKPSASSVSQWQMRFRKQLRLPYDADYTRMTTSTNNGIMEIYIPRRRQYMPADPYHK